MRKNNDGYVIIYVIFVILFLCIVAIGTCSSALSNLQSQNEAVVQMKEKYAVEGEIEKQVAELCAGLNGISGTNVNDPEDYTDAKVVEFFADTNVSVDTDDNQFICSFAEGATKAEVYFAYTVNSQLTIEEVIYKKDAEGNEITDENGERIIEEVIRLHNCTVSVTSKYLTYTTGGDAA